jgi:broad-specificity NMP kinase
VAAFLITGNPGSGKTCVASHLAALGFVALDTDSIAGWESASGVAVDQPADATDDWLADHRWVWRRERLEAAIRSHAREADPIFLCGIAFNQRQMLDLFARVFVLSIDHDTQVKRLDAPADSHRNAAQRAQILAGREVFEKEMAQAGAVLLDGREPTPFVVDQILQLTGLRARRPR